MKNESVAEVLDFLYDNDIINSNPAEKLSAPRVEHKPKDALSVDDAITLMSYGNKRERAIIAVFLNTGIRVQELIDMKLEDFLASPSEMTIKTKRGKYRTIYFNDDTYGTVRIVASSRNYPCGTILKFNVNKLFKVSWEYALKNMYCCFYNEKEQRYVTLDLSTTNADMMQYMTSHGWTISEYRQHK